MDRTIHRKNKFHSLVAILLIVVIGLVASVDMPEGFETAQQSKHRVLIDRPQTAILFAWRDSPAGENSVFANAKKRKKTYYDEDFIIFSLGSSPPGPSLIQRINDVSASKYRSFYSLGTLSRRHLLLTKYRDFVDLNTQQYGRSLH
ncbi:MAG: hypothetical protein A2074_05400 [Candidatus Aquicultor primus]|uniref:Uncharacterized protein n=1 Tax=Candidatus Aquicultor primus TaxID=1797195 RepID=A0A1F2UIJ3_9ACTN|nr:MAG: hypothetical protein A2074_05400 [Candidatus Aquicultor primus]HCG98749.1 hypothetical protein [Actinomycetota bacterium]